MTPGSCPSDTSAHPRSHGENAVAARMDRQQIGSSPLTRGKRIRLASTRSHFRLIPAHAGKTLEKTLAREPSGAHPRSRGENLIASSSMRHRSGSSPLTRGKRERLAHVGRRRRLIPAHAGKTRHTWERSQSRPAHPRSRGENRRTRYRMSSRGGSSPLTRGKRLSSLSLWGPLGLIPAHAGKTHTYWHRVGPRSAHPRSRGENRGLTAWSTAAAGSSPLTRGKQPFSARCSRIAGLIPAHAGKTTLPIGRASPSWAHPRSRGENFADLVHEISHLGSSPLTRGKPQKWSVVRVARRLIPAHAGKTRQPACHPGASEAHPRSRGENSSVVTFWLFATGSSPLTRGKPRRAFLSDEVAGLIPAHAGKTVAKSAKRCPDPAHPRSRGENALAGKTADELVGSSPLTRGKRPPPGGILSYSRLIPAHAGKTVLPAAFTVVEAAHPRSRGENARQGGPITSGPGSSPLTRGKLSGAHRGVNGLRLIPAHAGKTCSESAPAFSRAAHPRSRRENEAELSLSSDDSGSSPLTRGKRRLCRQTPSDGGLIPAHAGKTNNLK